jgi:magnesium-transporting ATPase (P-type)
MSVVLRDNATGILHVVSKGAETAMLPKCLSGPVEETARIVDEFATEGLRTLVFGHKVMDGTLDCISMCASSIH